MASIDYGLEFIVSISSDTIKYDISKNLVYIEPHNLALLGDHTLEIWLVLATDSTVQTNKNTVAFTVIDCRPQ